MIHPTPFLSIKVQKLVNEVTIPDICNLSDPSLGRLVYAKSVFIYLKNTQDTVYFIVFGHVLAARDHVLACGAT